MDGCWGCFISYSSLYAWSSMIIFRIFLILMGLLLLVIGAVTVFGPNINNIFLPFSVEGAEQSILVRTYAGFIMCCGYLTVRFVYSSSKVQIGTILLYIMSTMMIAKVFGFIYEGFTNYSVVSFFIIFALCISLYAIQKSRKNQISYDL